MNNTKTLGGFEPVSFPEFGVKEAIAKIDTGAYSGALHATAIREITDKDGKKLAFYPLGDKALATSTRYYRRKIVKSSNGEQETRYIVQTKIVLAGQEYPISISLSDRSVMMKNIIIGRRFLRRHHFIVDVRRGTEYRYITRNEEKP